MDNITHTLAGGLLGQMGLKRQSRFAMAACLLGANAPDIDVFAPLLFNVQGIAFHRGPTHAVLGWPLLAAAIVALLWLYDRWRPNPEAAPLRPWPLFIVTVVAVLTHPALDFLNTYGINILAPFSPKWVAGDAIFIVDWVFWLLMGGGIAATVWRERKSAVPSGVPALAAFGLLMAYVAFNLGLTTRVESATRKALLGMGVRPTTVVASPQPFAFWRRTMLWRDDSSYGLGSYSPAEGLRIGPRLGPLRLDNPRLRTARQRSAQVRAFLYWSRMPMVVVQDGRAYLTDQRFLASTLLPDEKRGRSWRYDPFLIPLD
jgi:inner membrane protein